MSIYITGDFMHDYNVWEKFHQKATVQCRATYEKPWTQLYYDNDCYPYDFLTFFHLLIIFSH